MKDWPKWAWVSRHAENSKNDRLIISKPGEYHSFPHSNPIWYCNRNWGPREYIENRLKMLKEEFEDLQKIINFFKEQEATSENIEIKKLELVEDEL